MDERNAFIARFLFFATALVLIAGLTSQFFAKKYPAKPILDKRVAVLVRDVVEKSARRLEAECGKYRTITVVPFAGDPTDATTETLRAQLDASEMFVLKRETFNEKAAILFSASRPSTSDMNDALAIGRRQKSDLTIFGVAKVVEMKDGKIYFSFRCQAAETESGKIVWKSETQNWEATQETSGNPNEFRFENSISWKNLIFRTICWLALVVLFPLFTFPFLRLATSSRSNGLVAAVLIGYSFVGIALAWVLLRPFLTSYVGVAICVGMSIFALIYNYRALSIASQRR